MILNAFAVLALLFLAALLVAGAVLAGTVLRAGRGTLLGSRDGGDPARALTVQLVGLIAFLSIASVALWGLLLQSYVPQWDGLRCAEGVLRVGTGSEGSPGYLPGLARAASWKFPSLLFLVSLPRRGCFTSTRFA